MQDQAGCSITIIDRSGNTCNDSNGEKVRVEALDEERLDHGCVLVQELFEDPIKLASMRQNQLRHISYFETPAICARDAQKGTSPRFVELENKVNWILRREHGDMMVSDLVFEVCQDKKFQDMFNSAKHYADQILDQMVLHHADRYCLLSFERSGYVRSQKISLIKW
jgi:hypothetical protein